MTGRRWFGTWTCTPSTCHGRFWGENADHLRSWLSPETLDGLPLVGGALSEYLTDGTDIISFVESAVSKIQEVDETAVKQIEVSSLDAVEANELPKE